MSDIDENTRRVLIFGASGGIGGAIVKRFAEQGCELLLHHRKDEWQAERLVTASHSRVEYLQLDFENWNGVLPDQLLQGRPFDIIVHSAGIVPKRLAQELSFVELDTCARVNFLAPVALSNDLMRSHRIATDASVIYIGSIHASDTAENFTAYSAAKAALTTAAKVQAIEWMCKGVHVNVVAPGPTVVARNRRSLLSGDIDWFSNIPCSTFRKCR